MIEPARTRGVALALHFLIIVAAVPAAAQVATQPSPRDEWQRVSDVMEAMGVRPGARVADVGAGGGYFTVRLSDAVGPTGRVYAVDIDESAVSRLRWTLDQRGAENVDVILSREDDAHLPYQALDAILIVNSYHEFEAYASMLAALRKALVPGGRLVLLDNPPQDPAAPRADQTRRHTLDLAFAVADLEQAGFHVVRTDADFIRRTGERGPRMWLLEARRPAREPPTQRLRGAPGTPEGDFACGFGSSSDDLRDRPSPPDSVELAIPGGGRVKVCYSRPSARDRAVMGELVPFGEPWRTGANEATVLRTDSPVRVAGVPLEPGWYSFYTIPGRETWQVVLNRLADRQGVPIDEWVREHDVGSGEAAVQRTAEHVETLTIRGRPEGVGRGLLVLEWERTQVRIPVERMAP